MSVAAERAVMVLRAARALIADPARWTQGEAARDARGAEVMPSSPAAVCWCAVGAITRITADKGASMWLDAARALSEFMGGSIPTFNDIHTHAEVLAAFDRAIAKLEGLIHGHA